MAKFNYKKLLSEKRFLRVQERARKLSSSNLRGIFYNKNTLIFQTKSATVKGKIWNQTIIIDDLTFEASQTLSFRDIERLIKESGLKIACDCPAFTYWGYKYMAWKRGYGIHKELRRPTHRNPQQKGFLCKHCYAVLQMYPFWAKPLASKFKKNVPNSDAPNLQGKDKFRK